MSGVYGDMLLFFPEQMRSLTVYEMTPKVNGGWTRLLGSDMTIIGIYQNGAGSRIKEGNGNLVKQDGLELWTATQNLAGKFTTYNGQVFRINNNPNWNFEGGFDKYTLEKVVGNDGTESDNASWNLGSNSFC